MSLFVNTNVSSLNTRRLMFTSDNNLTTSFARLSSGFRINTAADDASGQQISNGMTSQIMGMDQAIRNTNDGISLAQTAEGAMQEITASLQRIRALAVQSQNGINSSKDRLALQKEVSGLKQEMTRISDNTQFGGLNILDGTYSAAFQVGPRSGQSISVNISRNGGFGASALFGGTDLTVGDIKNASAAMTLIDQAMSTVNLKRADLGTIQNRFQGVIRSLSIVSENLSAARSRIRDADYATETAELTRGQIIQQASVTVLGQANQRPQSALSLLTG